MPSRSNYNEQGSAFLLTFSTPACKERILHFLTILEACCGDVKLFFRSISSEFGQEEGLRRKIEMSWGMK